MIYAFDVYYNGNIAQAVGIAFESWNDIHPKEVYKELIINIADYEPGAFYKRELPCLLKIIDKLDTSNASLMIIDGYVFLDDHQKPGLGYHLYEHLHRTVPVVGIAKKKFADINLLAREVYRGGSSQPLYVTATGVNVDEVAEKIRSMKGEFRIPALLKRLDHLSRN